MKMDKTKMELSKLYGVETKTRLYIGTYIGFSYTVNRDKRDKRYMLRHVIQKNKPMNPIWLYFMCTPRKYEVYVDFYPNDIVYDLEEIIQNGKKAREDMEKRAVDAILKRIVNENFEW